MLYENKNMTNNLFFLSNQIGFSLKNFDSKPKKIILKRLYVYKNKIIYLTREISIVNFVILKE